MRTTLSTLLVALSAALLILGFVLLDWRLLALIIPISVYLALGTVFGAPPPSVTITRNVGTNQAREGDVVDVSLRVVNRGRDLELLEIHDFVPPELEVAEGSNYHIVQLRLGEALEFTYRVRLPIKGRHSIGPITVRSRDLLNFFVHDRVVEDVSTIVTSPRREDVRRVDIRTRRTRPWLGQIPSRSPGLGTDFWSIRGYVAGDEMRRMNWKASARLDSLLTNEFEGERSGDFVIILDAREEMALGPFGENAVEMGVRAAVALASKLLETRNRVGLVVLKTILEWVYPAFGRKHLHRITDALVSVEPGGQWTLAHLPWVLGRFFPPGCQLIVISPMVDQATRQSLVELRARNFETMVLSPSVIDIEASMIEDDPVARVALSLLRLERETDIVLMRRFAPVANWRPDEPLALALREVEARRLRD